MLNDILPENLYNLIKKYVNTVKLFEIRLRLNKPIILNVANTIYGINEEGLCQHNKGIKASKQIINLGGLQEYSLNDTADILSNITGYNYKVYLNLKKDASLK